MTGMSFGCKRAEAAVAVKKNENEFTFFPSVGQDVLCVAVGRSIRVSVGLSVMVNSINSSNNNFPCTFAAEFFSLPLSSEQNTIRTHQQNTQMQ